MDGRNTVKYYIICNPSILNLDSFCTQCQIYTDSLTKEYIWHNEPFIMHPDVKAGVNCLCGSTNFGENINDEWFIVHVLYQLSKQYDDIIVKIYDDDGEFLLIQAADVLPRWLKPENSENRVFIHNGLMHIIPQPSYPGEMGLYPVSTPNLIQAYELVTGTNKTVACDSIQEAINQKLILYPEKIQQNFHRAHCYLPIEVVYALQKYPSIIARVVQSFYERDPADVAICSKMKTFRQKKMVMCSVKFTKHLYGQIYQANFLPSVKSGWKLPSPSDKLYKAAYLGYKLTCGFEILVARSDSVGHNDADPHGRKWQMYLSQLKKNDFFCGELEGSKLYTERLNAAKESFKKDFYSSLKIDEVGSMLSQLVTQAADHENEVRKTCECLPEDDNDDWMMLTPAELDEMLLKDWGKESSDPLVEAGNNYTHDQSDVENLSKLATSIKSFVDQVSSYEGAEEMLVNKSTSDIYDSEVEFDPNTFMDCVKNLLHGGEDKTAIENDSSDEYSSDVDEDFISCSKDDGSVDNELSHMMQLMDTELKQTNVSKSFFNANGEKTNTTGEIDAPLDLDFNVIENFLQSFASQDGLPGPVSTLMHNFGLNLPPDNEK